MKPQDYRRQVHINLQSGIETWGNLLKRNRHFVFASGNADAAWTSCIIDNKTIEYASKNNKHFVTILRIDMSKHWLSSKPAPDPPILDWLKWSGQDL